MNNSTYLKFIPLVLACISAPFAQASNSILPVAEFQYHGTCDGSAALRIDPQTLLVANDENNILLSYDVWGGDPVGSKDLFDLFPSLELKDGRDREMDVEAAAKFEDKIWWVASHGSNKSGKERLNRRSFFATNIPNRDLSNLVKKAPRQDLSDLFIKSPKLNGLITIEALETAPKRGGFNVEAMAFTDDGKLLIGLRSPLDGKKGKKGDATLVTLESSGGVWSITAATKLNLKNKGIRDIIRTESGYLLIAGDVESGGTFILYTLDDALKPTKLAALDPNKLNPEALVALNKQWLVLSDDGSELRLSENTNGKGNYQECKDILGKNVDEASDHPSVFFRGMVYPN